MHLHILGICGTFMGGLALLAKESGHRVSGCDANVYPPMSAQLAEAGIPLVEGFGEEQLSLRPDVWIVGNAMTRGNPLVEAILERGERYASGPQWLAENLLFGKQVIAVTGTHGKTTTASMLAWILQRGGANPGFLIGGVPRNFGVSARLGSGAPFVVEGDEYDTAFFDKRSKFVHYRARIAVIGNIEYDHADIFPDLAAIETQFHHFVRVLPAGGRLIVKGGDAAIERVLARGCWTPVERFGDGADWQAADAGPDAFDVLRDGRTLGRVRWNLLGEHNRQNALAAIAAASAAGVEPREAIAALSDFVGVKRRLEARGTAAGIAVYDDFAHHPSAIAATLGALRRKIGAARILAVFEPRSNTMRIGVMKDRLAQSLALADRVFCYGAGLGWDAAAALAPLGARAKTESDFERLLAAILAEAKPGDHILVMSNGGFGDIHEKLLAALRRREIEAAVSGADAAS